jgi:hypothetical protein
LFLSNYSSFIDSLGGERSSIANTASVSGFKGDVSIFSPAGSPRVLNDPVRAVVISDVQDTVVQLRSAVRENTSAVELPGFGINTDGDGLLVNSGLQSIAVS